MQDNLEEKSIRGLRETDREIFFNMVQAFYSSDAVDHKINLKNIEKTFENFVKGKDESLKIYIIEYGEKICGYAILAVYWSNEAGGKAIQIEEIFIMKEYRSLGLGKNFFNYIFKVYYDAVRFRLEATTVNQKAIALYRKIGFKELNYLQFIIDKQEE